MMTKLSVGLAVLLAALSGACSDESEDPATGRTGGAGGGSATGGGGGGGEPSCVGTESTDELFSQALQILRDELASQGVPGGAIAIVKDGELVNLGVAGSKRVGECDPVTEDTLFGAAFVTQLLTSIAALDAVEDGKISLTEPITLAIPTLNVERGDIDLVTLDHLLAHSSTYRSASAANPLQATCTSLADAFGNAVDPVLQAIPGTMQDESHWNDYEIAGLALENVDKKSYPEVIAARVLGPLGMGGTLDTPSLVASTDRSLGYFSGSNEAPAENECPNHAPALGYHGSIRDLAKLAQYLTSGGGGILEAGMLDAALSDQGPNFWNGSYATYGAGEGLSYLLPGEDYLLLLGYANGFFTRLDIFRNRRLAVITVLNSADSDPSVISEAITLLHDPTADLHQIPEHVVDPDSLPSLVGTYVDEFGVDGLSPRTVEVFLKPGDPGNLAGMLTDSAGNAQPISLEGVWSADNFLVDDMLVARFWRDDAEQGYAIQLGGDFGPPFFRVPDPI